MKPENYPTHPSKIWQHFYEITRIPRPSKAEEQIREYLINFAKDNRVEYKTDDVGNVIMYVPATTGYEDHEAVIIQNHMDMVTDARVGKQIDFNKDPIDLKVVDGWLKADDTTLGADNGIGCAAALACVTDGTLEHPALELLFTVDEETGLNGALGVQGEMFKGKKLINLDTEEWGSLYTGCAGGIDYEFNTQVTLAEKTKKKTYKVNFGGLIGGHSGVDIHLQHANAIKLLNDFLIESNGYELCEIRGGRAHNIIPRDAFTIIAVDEISSYEAVAAELKTRWNNYLTKDDADLEITFEEVAFSGKVVSQADKERFLSFLSLFPHGAHTYLPHDRELVAISNNLAKCLIVDGNFYVQSSLRFFDRGEIISIENKMESLARGFKIDVSKNGEYPSWKPVENNKLLDHVKETYKEIFNDNAHVTAIHAGLECGILRDQIGDIDAVSFGPTIMGAHSPDERMEIATVEPFWNLLKETLRRL
jgi:dipeptidase D